MVMGGGHHLPVIVVKDNLATKYDEVDDRAERNDDGYKRWIGCGQNTDIDTHPQL